MSLAPYLPHLSIVDVVAGPFDVLVHTLKVLQAEGLRKTRGVQPSSDCKLSKVSLS